ncbi:hypothetical protein SAMN04487948_11087 [Halogranum amylolyticum]|uniref:Uncharacterized protein n=1 Tax=Halogranum amylolyticum TaxID=660520 RepID=A0A1H8UBC8_9EURY|nr:hypothetical protein SAMN04487948_11087 [Halogranum amylolyticum]
MVVVPIGSTDSSRPCAINTYVILTVWPKVSISGFCVMIVVVPYTYSIRGAGTSVWIKIISMMFPSEIN